MENSPIKPSDIARKKFKDAGLSYSSLSRDDLRNLRKIVSGKVRLSGLMDSTFKVYQRYKHMEFKAETLYQAYFRCQSHYFGDREAISFNRDGFIGFCGWADSKHQQPIIEGFNQWLDDLIAAKS